MNDIKKYQKISKYSDVQTSWRNKKKTDRFEYEEFGAPRSPSLEQFRTHFVVVRFSTPESRNAPTSQHLSFKLKIRKWSTQCTKFSTQKVEDDDRQCPFRCFPAFLYFYISYIFLSDVLQPFPRHSWNSTASRGSWIPQPLEKGTRKGWFWSKW